MTSVLNSPDWFVQVFVLFAFDYAYMGKLTLSLYYFDLHTIKMHRIHTEIIIFSSSCIIDCLGHSNYF